MKYLCVMVLSLFSVFAISGVYAHNIQSDLSENLLRLHIIANSNMEEDQEIKLKVRDEILKVSGASPDKALLNNTANQVLEKLGAGYTSETRIERTYVPEKVYNGLRLPEGIYNCINVILGEGKGENWWCIAYPPLCFTEEVFGGLSENGRLILENQLDEESFRAIVYGGNVNIRFKILDEFAKLKNKLW